MNPCCLCNTRQLQYGIGDRRDVHPETGEKHLLLGHFVKRILGLSTRDSDHLFELFQGHVTRLENAVRWTWRSGDVAFWDNRATQHYAVDDYGAARRIMHRVTIAGVPAVGVDASNSSKTVKRQPHTAILVAKTRGIIGVAHGIKLEDPSR